MVNQTKGDNMTQANLPVSLSTFFDRFPGPFEIKKGIDGVDLTFDLYCQATQSFILNVGFSEDEKTAQVLAATYSIALNRVRPTAQTDVLPHEAMTVDQFLRTTPGPFYIEFSPERSQPHGTRPTWTVICDATGEAVVGIESEETDSNSQQLVSNVCSALNVLKEHHK